ncbi:hypothetical protein ACLBWS_12245 [Brucellaceae bacterium D45D]
MSYDLTINIQTNVDLSSWKKGKELLSGIFSDAKLTPQRVATFGEVTVKHGFDVSDIQMCEKHWASKGSMRVSGVLCEFTQDFHWKRTKVAKSQGVVTFPSVNLKGKKIPGRLLLQSQYRKEVDWISLFKGWCETAQAYAGILHPLISQEGPQKSDHDVRDNSFAESVQQQAWSRFLGGELCSEFRAGELNSLVSGLTNLGWATWFGGDLANEVDQRSIAAAGFPIYRLDSGYLIQVTDDINDVVNDFAMFSKRRAELKSLFKSKLFLIKDEPVST